MSPAAIVRPVNKSPLVLNLIFMLGLSVLLWGLRYYVHQY